MKKIIAFMLTVVFCAAFAMAEDAVPATPATPATLAVGAAKTCPKCTKAGAECTCKKHGKKPKRDTTTPPAAPAPAPAPVAK
jgi:hypothetical protein